MMEPDPLRPVLREWQAPPPPPAMDARIAAAYRAAYRPSPGHSSWSGFWRSFWSARISLPAPALAALLLLIAALVLVFRAAPPAHPVLHLDSTVVAQASDRRYETRLDATGFQPLPNGAARVVKSVGIEQ
jgi:hypothetical protein